MDTTVSEEPSTSSFTVEKYPEDGGSAFPEILVHVYST
jgi:hypothetical protein